MSKTKKQGYVVTTAHKGVFFGYSSDGKTVGKKIELTNARMCIYWPSNLKGVLGLAAKGPNSQSKISFEVPSMLLEDVTSVMGVTAGAEKGWLKAPWA